MYVDGIYLIRLLTQSDPLDRFALLSMAHGFWGGVVLTLVVRVHMALLSWFMGFGVAKKTVALGNAGRVIEYHLKTQKMRKVQKPILSFKMNFGFAQKSMLFSVGG